MHHWASPRIHCPSAQGHFVSVFCEADWQDIFVVPLRNHIICHAVSCIVAAQAPGSARRTIQGSSIVLSDVGLASFRHMYAASRLAPLQRAATPAALIGLIPLAAIRMRGTPGGYILTFQMGPQAPHRCLLDSFPLAGRDP